MSRPSRQFMKCIKSAGLKAKVVHLEWAGLHAPQKGACRRSCALPNGTCLVLRRIEGEPEQARVVLQDPNADDDALLVIDRMRFEAVMDRRGHPRQAQL